MMRRTRKQSDGPGVVRQVLKRWLVWPGLVAGLWVAGFLSTASFGADATSPELAAQEKAACIKNLKQIYQAIQAYERDHKELPNWLSDLVPQYLPDANVLVCPVSRRTGKTEVGPLSDPKLPSSYLYEFCPVPMGRVAPNRTRRDWKRRQMGLLGSVVPIVRCRNHDPVLNLAFDGRIYESSSLWERNFTNLVSAEDLGAAHIFAHDPGHATAAAAARERHFPPRDPKAAPQLLDLTDFYDAMLTETWHPLGGRPGNDLASLPEGIQSFGGIPFDVRGIVQLRGKAKALTNYPAIIKGIRVGQTCHHLYFLHAAGVGRPGDEGKQLATYVVHYAVNGMRVDIPIVYGEAVRDWHIRPDEPPPGKDLKVVWTGDNGVTRNPGEALRLFLTTWTNPIPSFPVESLDLVSSMADAAPFVIGITAD